MNNTFDLVCIYSQADTSQPFFPSIFTIQVKKRYLLTRFLCKFMRTAVICDWNAHRWSDEAFSNVFLVSLYRWKNVDTPFYIGLFSFFSQPISITTLSEYQCVFCHYLKRIWPGNCILSLSTAAGTGSASEKVMGDFCSLPWQSSSDSGHCSVPAESKGPNTLSTDKW